jgi:hypothetical protein
MKTKISNPLLPLTMLAITATLITSLISATTILPVYAQEDKSETNTEQALRQKNAGSDDSTNTNCAQNSISSSNLDNTCVSEEEAPPLPLPATCLECFTTILSPEEISSFEAALSAGTGGELTTISDACLGLEINEPPTTVGEARTFLIGAGVSPEHAVELTSCLLRLGLLVEA